jgi:hypothetical protein
MKKTGIHKTGLMFFQEIFSIWFFRLIFQIVGLTHLKSMSKMTLRVNKSIHVVLFNFIHQFYDSEIESDSQ